MKTTMTLVQANATIERADRLFLRAARAWERGNNSGNSDGHARGVTQCERFRNEAEKLLTPLGIAVDYPGLYPSFTLRPRLFVGAIYDVTRLSWDGWTAGDGTGHEGYNARDYFAADGRYLGADAHGIEPIPGGFCHHTTESAVSAALEVSR